MTVTTPIALDRHWPAEGVTRVPFWAYSDPSVYEQEMRLIFGGESWAYVGLEVEIPQRGDFKQATIGDRPVVMVRDTQGDVHVFVNRCMHRGVKLCRVPSGHVQHFTCPYHQWTYDLQGRLRGVPFHRGVKQRGGMPDDFTREAYGAGGHPGHGQVMGF